MRSVNPATGELIRHYAPHNEAEIERRIHEAHLAFLRWRETSLAERALRLRRAAELLRERSAEFAGLMAEEMGKPLADGEAEIEKCAFCCEYYAEHAPGLLADQPVATEAAGSFITYQPLGVILAIMPWNFPFWQVFRFAAPNLMAGNVALLKHASNVTGCALAIEALFRDAGFMPGCFSTLLLSGSAVDPIIEHKLVRAVTLTGSEKAGRAVAAKAGSVLKKTVLELGGSDPYVVLEDADVAAAAAICAKSRLINAGQSCIAAKRFIVLSPVKEAFTRHLLAYFQKIRVGNPKEKEVDLGPMARVDLRDALHDQVQRSIAQGAKLLLGGTIPPGAGAYYLPTVLDRVTPGMPAFDEELFGPVAAIIEAKDEEEAFVLANQSEFGLGSAIFTADQRRAQTLARTAIHAGQTFVNSLVKSDPRLPFGGVNHSGYGRELGAWGLYEFMNIKTVSMG